MFDALNVIPAQKWSGNFLYHTTHRLLPVAEEEIQPLACALPRNGCYAADRAGGEGSARGCGERVGQRLPMTYTSTSLGTL